MLNVLKFTNKSKFKSDVLWNAVSYVVMGISGTILNVFVLQVYGTKTLGVFNQVYAIYLLSSHLAVFGIFASVIKHTAEFSENKRTYKKIFSSALMIGIFISTLVCFIYYYAAEPIGTMLNSTQVRNGLKLTTLGLRCFSINKIILAFLNGKRRMKAFAILNIFRYASLPTFLFILILYNFPGDTIPIILTLTEFSLLLILTLVVLIAKYFTFDAISWHWIKKHIQYGGKIFGAGAASAINTKIDVLMLGVFCSDKLVGIYSFASMLVEGFAQVTTIFKVNYNPLITKHIVDKKLLALETTINRFIRPWMLLIFTVSIIATVLFPYIIELFSFNIEVLDGWCTFSILIFGFTMKSGYAVFSDLPSQSGFPGHQTLFIMLVVFTNIVLNLIFIPLLTLNGAAIATALSSILSIYYLKIITKRTIGINI